MYSWFGIYVCEHDDGGNPSLYDVSSSYQRACRVLLDLEERHPDESERIDRTTIVLFGHQRYTVVPIKVDVASIRRRD